MAQDPYTTLGVNPSATDAELRSAYRRLVQLHHPDHNRGSAESARRFEDVQAAYARVRELRAGRIRTPPRRTSAGGTPPRRTSAGAPPPRPASDPGLEARLADLERELREAQLARERVARAARDAVAEDARPAGAPDGKRPSDEELGYIKTDDSLSKILTDARDSLLERLEDVRAQPEAKRSADRAAQLLDDVGAMLRGERRKPSDG